MNFLFLSNKTLYYKDLKNKLNLKNWHIFSESSSGTPYIHRLSKTDGATQFIFENSWYFGCCWCGNTNLVVYVKLILGENVGGFDGVFGGFGEKGSQWSIFWYMFQRLFWRFWLSFWWRLCLVLSIKASLKSSFRVYFAT